ncbi:MAG TPA: hypothetical protein VMP13_08980 [Acidimicrobiia bacterium]|nr:hypothetical protein [Acidimicrobiia bacterium]
MPDISVQLRDYIESVAPTVEEEEVLSHPLVRVPAPTVTVGAQHPLGFGLVTTVLVVAIALVALLLGSPVGGPDLRSVPLSSVDVCDLLVDATRRAGQPWGSMTHRHEPTPWEADVCVHDGWDSGWDFRHLILRLSPTSTDEAQQILARHDLLRIPMEWEVERPGVWIANARGSGEAEFYAVAVSAAPYFFIVTYADREDALAVADAVLVELGIEKGDQ